MPHRQRISFDASAGPSSVHPEGEKEEDDDRDSVVSANTVFDRTFVRLISFVYDQFPGSRLLSSTSLPPRYGFENLFAVADPQGSSRPKLCLYPCVSEIVSSTQARSTKLAPESKPIRHVLPLKRRMFAVADKPSYTRLLLFVNPDFSRLTANKSFAKTRAGSVSFFDMERSEKYSRSLLEGNSHAL